MAAEREVSNGSADRRVHELAGLPGVRFVTDSPLDIPTDVARVEAVLVSRAEPRPRPPRGTCHGGGSLAGARAELAQAPRGGGARTAGAATPAIVRFGCFSSGAPEAAVLTGGELHVLGGEPGKIRRLGHTAVEGARFLATVDLDEDGRDEIFVGTERRTTDRFLLDLRIVRLEGGRFVDVLTDRSLAVSAAAAAAAGVTPSAIDFSLDVRSARGVVTVEGIYFTRSGPRIDQLAPLTPVVLKVPGRHQNAGTSTIDAALPEPAALGVGKKP